eukprot:4574673-Amphidinium_carterae.1
MGRRHPNFIGLGYDSGYQKGNMSESVNPRINPKMYSNKILRRKVLKELVKRFGQFALVASEITLYRWGSAVQGSL